MDDSTKWARPIRIGVAALAVAGCLAVGWSAPASATPTTETPVGDAACEASPSRTGSGEKADGSLDDEDQVDEAEEADYDRWVRQQGSARAAGVDVTVHFHNFAANARQRLTYQQVLDQLNRMNNAYAGGQGGAATSFEFVLGSYENVDVANSRINVDSARGNRLKRNNHVGTKATLNVYTAQTIVDDDGDALNGEASFPWEVDDTPRLDGVWLDRNVLVGVPGGPAERDGDTLVHETGHWLGLYHVFQGYCRGTGDRVDDTGRMSQTSAANRDNCRDRDTCGNDAGRGDPVRNFMSYADDDCRSGFTAGQATRMSNQWTRHRA